MLLGNVLQRLMVRVAVVAGDTDPVVALAALPHDARR